LPGNNVQRRRGKAQNEEGQAFRPDLELLSFGGERYNSRMRSLPHQALWHIRF
jgi:hypothetical protein